LCICTARALSCTISQCWPCHAQPYNSSCSLVIIAVGTCASCRNWCWHKLPIWLRVRPVTIMVIRRGAALACRPSLHQLFASPRLTRRVVGKEERSHFASRWRMPTDHAGCCKARCLRRWWQCRTCMTNNHTQTQTHTHTHTPTRLLTVHIHLHDVNNCKHTHW